LTLMPAFSIELVLFGALALVAVAGAVAMVLARSPVHSVLYLVVTILALAGEFLTLDAQFLAALQVIVYAGAIMVLFLFVIMMLNLGPDRGLSGPLGRPAAFFLGGLFMVVLASGVAIGVRGSGGAAGAAPAMPHGTVENVGSLLLTRYVLPMELASILLLVGMVGAVALARPWHEGARRVAGPGARSGVAGGDGGPLSGNGGGTARRGDGADRGGDGRPAAGGDAGAGTTEHAGAGREAS
jgi:NADH-quinone oxidoreductase subunit J